jgi:hypothetical protein
MNGRSGLIFLFRHAIPACPRTDSRKRYRNRQTPTMPADGEETRASPASRLAGSWSESHAAMESLTDSEDWRIGDWDIPVVFAISQGLRIAKRPRGIVDGSTDTVGRLSRHDHGAAG